MHPLFRFEIFDNPLTRVLGFYFLSVLSTLASVAQLVEHHLAKVDVEFEPLRCSILKSLSLFDLGFFCKLAPF